MRLRGGAGALGIPAMADIAAMKPEKLFNGYLSVLAVTCAGVRLASREGCHPPPGSLALPHSGSPTILVLTCWVSGTNSSTLVKQRARSHQTGEPKRQIHSYAMGGSECPPTSGRLHVPPLSRNHCLCFT